MTKHMIDELVSIYKKPPTDETHLAGAGVQITIGDLHANTMKFIYTLVRHGIITDITDENYDDLVSIYLKDIDELDKNDLERYAQIISSLKFNNSVFIRLLGDELSDRGSNDYFTLLLIRKMHEENLKMEITISNHAIEFVNAYETKRKFFPSTLESHFVQSMVNMQILMAKKLITRAEVLAIIKNNYKPYLKAVSYSLSEDNNEITLYSHAPIDMRAIRALAKKFALTFEDYSAVVLAKTIDAINVAYQSHVVKNTVHTLFDSQVMEDGYYVRSFSPLYNPIEYITWNRDIEHLDQRDSHKGYKIFYAHGHDSQVSENKNVFNLDNQLGKTADLYLGQYTALYSHDKQLSLALKPFLGRISSQENKGLEEDNISPQIKRHTNPIST